jgi:D-glycero-alpha-D-manno-heptose-7-phosphate kinase
VPELNDEVLICYSGRSRLSGINNWQIYKAVMEHDPTIRKLLQEIGFHSEGAGRALARGSWQELLEHSHKEWQIRTQLSGGIETDETRAIDEAACRAGAYFTRICGAGGGGVMALFVPKEKREQIRRAAQGAGGRILAARFTDQGVSI